jgi:aspartyl-tRNA(Asn)/glutamyl-tRNA(Gln) amidotransferase subunit C
MKIDETLLQRLEKLSFLQIPDDSRSQMMEQMSEIVSFVDNLSQLDTNGVNPTFSMENSATVLREDSGSVDGSINDDILTHSPHSQDHFFIVPKIIE